ncbi:MAG: Beta-lactamase domain protein [Parcubacteria group bacterium GW2011_GWC2_39_14]|nr:MAG: Beta-lactamase domain protein [Parcubacteria group bacterium GW2011_GWC2_39_14]KKR53949.1 MAG: Beta-lactamase domain protein [Parcubacteria group bacterium GW2011_GWA2_40_23]
MKLKAYGTFGSLAVFIPGRTIGGNTTCYRIDSPCLPADTWLVNDGGTGFAVLCADALKAGVKRIIVLLTHYHHDHTQGLLLGAATYIKGIKVTLVGPLEDGWGPHKVLMDVMKKPLHPRAFQLEASHFVSPVELEYPQNQVLLLHPEGGFKVLGIDTFERLCDKGDQLPFRKGQKFALNECLVIRMLRTDHPEKTISYRFDEGPTGKSFVFLTDHANQDGVPADLKQHLKSIDLLIQDVQYNREEYDARTAGFGHGTPDYAVRLCNATGVKRVGFTHHHFMWDDAKIEANVTAAQELAAKIIAQTVVSEDADGLLKPEGIFLVRDYMEIDV